MCCWKRGCKILINLPNHLPSGKEQNMKVNQFDNVPTREDAVFLIETSSKYVYHNGSRGSGHSGASSNVVFNLICCFLNNARFGSFLRRFVFSSTILVEDNHEGYVRLRPRKNRGCYSLLSASSSMLWERWSDVQRALKGGKMMVGSWWWWLEIYVRTYTSLCKKKRLFFCSRGYYPPLSLLSSASAASDTTTASIFP